MDICCSKCMLCKVGTDPTFCYEQIYKKEPKLFIKTIFRRLLEMNKWLLNQSQGGKKEYEEELEYIFKNSFCKDGFCNDGVYGQCKKTANCLLAFKSQLTSGPRINVRVRNTNYEAKPKKSKKEKRKDRFVAKPYPTFFCNEPFKTEVEGLLINEDYDIKQNKDTGSARADEKSTGGEVACCQS